jgi:membrane associated rhomboid family serine protease
VFKNQSTFERLLSLLQGASWAVVFIGAFYAFSSFYPFGLLIALLASFLGSLFGLLLVVLFELAQVQVDKLNEMKKQTLLLEELLKSSKIDETVPHN